MMVHIPPVEQHTNNVLVGYQASVPFNCKYAQHYIYWAGRINKTPKASIDLIGCYLI